MPTASLPHTTTNENPVDAQRCRDIIKSNLPNGTRAECEEGMEEEVKRKKKGMMNTWNHDTFYTRQECQPHSKNPDPV